MPGLGIELACSPLLDSQEVQASESVTPTYWEGAVRYSGTRNGNPLEGVGYLEMTGYDRKIRSEDSPFRSEFTDAMNLTDFVCFIRNFSVHAYLKEFVEIYSIGHSIA